MKPASAPLSVLLIEDSAADARLLMESLRDWTRSGEVVIQVVRRLADAVAELKRMSFSCVLLDLGLPDGMGVSNVEALRAVDRKAAIIVLTGLDSDASAKSALKLGAQEYMLKGQYEGAQLVKLMRHAVQRNLQVSELEEQRAREFEQASLDPVTGLVNRQLFEDRARQVIGGANLPGGHFALCFIDLNRFKRVNDTHGHAVGDRVLARVGQLLRESVRDTDTVGRLGGDEFAILLTSAVKSEPLRAFAQRVSERICALRRVDGHDIDIGCSIGIAIYPEHGESLEALLHASDLAMYQAKSAGGGALCVGDQLDQARATDEAALRARVTEAIALDRFSLDWHPWADSAMGRFCGVEALVRWADGDEIQLPDAFLPAVQDAGQMPDLGLHVAAKAARQWRQWREQGLACDWLALNLSESEFTSENFLPRLLGTLSAAGVGAGEVQLEVPAGASTRTDASGRPWLERFRAEGFRIVLDRFSPAQGALAALAQPFVGGIKLDRSIVQSLAAGAPGAPSRRFAAAVIGAAAALDLPVIATGVESSAEMAALGDINCRYAQGLYVAERASAEAVSGALRAGPRLA